MEPKTAPGDSRRGRAYPWGKWFNQATRRKVRLLRRRDFPGLPHGFAATARNAASRAGVRLSVTIDEDAVTIEVVG